MLNNNGFGNTFLTKTPRRIYLITAVLILFSCSIFESPDESLTVSIVQPVNGDTVAVPITIRTSVENDALQRVDFLIDDKLIGSDETFPYEQLWNIYDYSVDQWHMIQSKAVDKNDNTGVSSVIEVYIKLELAVPQLIAPDFSAIITSDSVSMEWLPVTDATSYFLEIATDYEFANTIDSATVPALSYSQQLERGSYFWRVKAIGNDGAVSAWSSTKHFYIGEYHLVEGVNIRYSVDAKLDLYGMLMLSVMTDLGETALIKLDAEFNIDWMKLFGSDVLAFGGIILVDPNMGFILTGTRDDSIGSRRDAAAIKVDNSGEIIWELSFGFRENDEVFGSIFTNDGNIISVGYTDSISYYNDLFIWKFDQAGNELWHKTIGGDGNDRGYSILQTGDNGFLILGNTTSYGAGSWDHWLVKTDSLGNMEWNKTYGGPGYERFGQVLLENGPNYIIGCNLESGTSDLYDIWIINVDEQGNIITDHLYDFEGQDFLTDMLITSEGNYLITGMTSAASSDGADILIFKTSPTGDILWQRTFGGIGGDAGIRIFAMPDGTYTVVCETYSYSPNNEIMILNIDTDGNLLN